MYQETGKIQTTSYECKQSGIIVQGSYSEDVVNGQIRDVNGTCYRPNEQGEIGDRFGNFNGYLRGGELKFSLSEMNRRDSNLTWGCIDEVVSEMTTGGSAE